MTCTRSLGASFAAQPALSPEFADECLHFRCSLRHFAEFRFKRRERIVRPLIDQIGDAGRIRRAWTLLGRGNFYPSLFLQKIDERVDRNFHLEILLDPGATGRAMACSELRISAERFECISK